MLPIKHRHALLEPRKLLPFFYSFAPFIKARLGIRRRRDASKVQKRLSREHRHDESTFSASIAIISLFVTGESIAKHACRLSTGIVNVL